MDFSLTNRSRYSDEVSDDGYYNDTHFHSQQSPTLTSQEVEDILNAAIEGDDNESDVEITEDPMALGQIVGNSEYETQGVQGYQMNGGAHVDPYQQGDQYAQSSSNNTTSPVLVNNIPVLDTTKVPISPLTPQEIENILNAVTEGDDNESDDVMTGGDTWRVDYTPMALGQIVGNSGYETQGVRGYQMDGGALFNPYQQGDQYAQSSSNNTTSPALVNNPPVLDTTKVPLSPLFPQEIEDILNAVIEGDDNETAIELIEGDTWGVDYTPMALGQIVENSGYETQGDQYAQSSSNTTNPPVVVDHPPLSDIVGMPLPSLTSQEIEDILNAEIEGDYIYTKDLCMKISAELRTHEIPQHLFSERIINRSQGTLSDLLKKPRPWSSLRTARKTYIRMYNWLSQPLETRMAMVYGQPVGSVLQMTRAQEKPKKARVVFTETQKRTLERVFKEVKRPSRESKQQIADHLGLEFTQIDNFFQNARRRRPAN
ncbi:hypothetical protein CAEBREN_14492 [Caenorhabditis brenneri]|uniref:One cut domain family member n=1 Tax=Caenorhabditis brenneri TaxID=135651 RepID=G0MQX9_CAEBE|nr:hypothetical protein CAEBREN_14492 [Caenorhabditis brenneri]